MDKARIDTTMDTILAEVKNEIAAEEKKAADSLSHLSEKPINEMTAAEIKEIEKAINAAAQQDAARASIQTRIDPDQEEYDEYGNFRYLEIRGCLHNY